jgi:hypothetical protein
MRDRAVSCTDASERVGTGEAREPSEAGSTPTVDRDVERAADLSHPGIGEAARSGDQHGKRDALDRVKVDRAGARDRIFARFQDDLAGKRADGRRAWCDERTSKSRDRGVTGQDHDRTPTDVGQLAPPQLASSR